MRRRLQLPRTTADRAGLFTFVFGGVFLLWYEVLHILPTYTSQQVSDGDFVGNLVQYIIAVVLAVNIYGNMYQLITHDISGKHVVFPSGPSRPGWHYCDECQINTPPRSHHCKVCRICVLKRDHHCWFAGYCIGYHNHRYYVAMVIHMVVAAAYCNIYNQPFVSGVKGGLGFWNLLSFIGPHIGLLFGFFSIYEFFITCVSTLGFTLLVLFSWLLQIQIVQIYHGQTKYEHKKGIDTYNWGLKWNIMEVMGQRWWLALICPWVESPLLGDGVSFSSKSL